MRVAALGDRWAEPGPPPSPRAMERVSGRVERLNASYAAPRFDEVPGPDAALFLTAIDHRTGYRGAHLVGSEGPFSGSALLWALGLQAERRAPGTLAAPALIDVAAGEVETMFAAAEDRIAGPELRAELWRDAAAHLAAVYSGSAQALIDASGSKLRGAGGLIERLAAIRAFSDPIEKKAFLVAKIWERRGWLTVSDPGSWHVCADNVLMRLALRSGLLEPAPVEQLRSATRAAWRLVADRTGIAPPVLDDLLWERGREDPDLLGAGAGDLREPPRPPGTFFY